MTRAPLPHWVARVSHRERPRPWRLVIHPTGARKWNVSTPRFFPCRGQESSAVALMPMTALQATQPPRPFTLFHDSGTGRSSEDYKDWRSSSAVHVPSGGWRSASFRHTCRKQRRPWALAQRLMVNANAESTGL